MRHATRPLLLFGALLALGSGCARFGFAGDADGGTDTADAATRDSRTLADSSDGSSPHDTPADRSPADWAPADLAPADLAPADRSPADRSPADLSPADLLRPDRWPLDHGSPDASLAIGSWVGVAAGVFQMGAQATDACYQGNEGYRTITLTRGFQIAATLVTQAQFSALRGYNSSVHKNCPTCPVEYVNWHEAAAYCNALPTTFARCYVCTGSGPAVSCTVVAAYGGTQIYGCRGYRLPTEAEWEYAYRAGTGTGYYSGDPDPTRCNDCAAGDPKLDATAWYCANAGGTTHPVAGKAPNAWGIYDMAGDLYQWCHDGYQPNPGTAAATDPVNPTANNDKVLKSGTFASPPRLHRGASRGGAVATFRDALRGFRCVQTLVP